jgi:iron complex outermembrane receptor protein
MFRILFLLLLAGLPSRALTQQIGLIKGTVTDAFSGEALFTVNVYHASTSKGTTTDFDGKYSMNIPYGSQVVTFSLVGYDPIEKTIEINKPVTEININLTSMTLKEVTVTSSFITDERTTPYSITTIQPKKIAEELASQDLPMILNSTPGVYATQQGGGDGDARITIRGFNQRNVAVMVDGVPVNDMEVGWVYWSNWFGLDMATRSIQLQRGLGASKIAIPSIGGTMNIITKGLDSYKGGSVKQEVGTGGFLRTSFSMSTGRNEKGWGATAAFSYKRGNGWVENAFTEGYFYFLKIEKQYKKHLFSLSGFGAPQKHAQRSFKKAIEFYDSEYAAKLGIDTTGAKNHGLQFNEHWGYLDRNSTGLADTGANPTVMYERLNYFHKPQITLKDFWTVNDKLSISTLAYLSIGNGGGTSAGTTTSSTLSTQTDFTPEGQIDFQKFYNTNKYGPFSIDALYSLTEHKSSRILRSSVNNHRWVGMLSTFNYNLNDEFTISGGIDFRDYVGEHYRQVYDLLGGDYAIDNLNKNAASDIRRVGDKIGYNNDGLVRWAGMFGQAEYKKNVWSAFINLSGATSGYKRIDYFRKKTITLDGEEYTEALGYGDQLFYNGSEMITAFEGSTVTTNGDTTFVNNSGTVNDGFIIGAASPYTIESKETKYDQTKWKWLPGFTIKGGANYMLNEFNNIYMNLGYLSRTPRFNNVIDNSNEFFRSYQNEALTTKQLMSLNEKITAIELGYGSKYEKMAVNINAYYTMWKNRPLDFSPTITIDDQIYSLNITGINALHKGVELDFAYMPINKLTIEGSISLGDWTWESGQSAYLLDENNQYLIDDNDDTVQVDFDATNVHVGDAAQTQFAGIIRYEFAPDAYVKARFVHFSNQYANFDPFDLTGDNKGRESWKMPAYGMTELHAGYRFKLDKIRLDLRASVINLFDVVFLTDAQNNDSFLPNSTSNFDANSASVFFGQGRRYNVSLQISF